MSLLQNYKDQLLDWQEQSNNQQETAKRLSILRCQEATERNHEIKKMLGKVEADNFNEMIQGDIAKK